MSSPTPAPPNKLQVSSCRRLHKEPRSGYGTCQPDMMARQIDGHSPQRFSHCSRSSPLGPTRPKSGWSRCLPTLSLPERGTSVSAHSRIMERHAVHHMCTAYTLSLEIFIPESAEWRECAECGLRSSSTCSSTSTLVQHRKQKYVIMSRV